MYATFHVNTAYCFYCYRLVNPVSVDTVGRKHCLQKQFYILTENELIIQRHS